MSIKTISILSGATLLALTATASAGPISVASSQVIAPPTSIEQAHYYRHHGWRHGMHYGWYGHRYYSYGYGYPGYYHWGYAGAMPAVGVTSEPASGDYCATPERHACSMNPDGWERAVPVRFPAAARGER